MQITIISDTHNEHDLIKLDSGDLLIHCGDVGTKGIFTEGSNFLWWFVKQPFKYKILVPGNHDKKLKEHPELISLAKNLGIHMLQNEGITLEGISFWGGTFVAKVRDGKYKQSFEERVDAWKNMPSAGVDILITHSPPQFILDANERGEHCGCDILLSKVRDLKPKYHLFGHIHEQGHKEVKTTNTTYINCCNKNHEYKLTYPPKKIEF